MNDPTNSFREWWLEFWGPDRAVLLLTNDLIDRGIKLCEHLADRWDLEFPSDLEQQYQEYIFLKLERGPRPEPEELVLVLLLSGTRARSGSYAGHARFLLPFLHMEKQRLDSARLVNLPPDARGKFVEFIPNFPTRGQGTVVMKDARGLVDIIGPLTLVRDAFATMTKGMEFSFYDNHRGMRAVRRVEISSSQC